MLYVSAYVHELDSMCDLVGGPVEISVYSPDGLGKETPSRSLCFRCMTVEACLITALEPVHYWGDGNP